MLSLLLRFFSMLRPLLLASWLLVCGAGSGFAAADYGSRIAQAPSARDVAPFVAPFVLFSVASAAALALSFASVVDAAESLAARRSSRRSRSRLS